MSGSGLERTARLINVDRYHCVFDYATLLSGGILICNLAAVNVKSPRFITRFSIIDR